MKVYKFGGASVKDAESVKNLVEVIKTVGYEDTFLVVSAMGKTTNALEEVVRLYFQKNNFTDKLDEIKAQHFAITQKLFEDSQIQSDLELLFDDLNDFLGRNKSPNYDFVYDQVVGYGELISTKIISAYLNSVGVFNKWVDVRNFIKTDDTYREGKVDWSQTESNFKKLDFNQLYVTQGFLGSDSNFFTTTLGREGSDYTAAIIANCLNAESMTIWKDVPGVLNADPRFFKDTQLLRRISYEEAIELAYYGASVIHPKTMRPLREKGIPFYVKSFINPKGEGTLIKKGQALDPIIPCYIVKQSQHLLKLTTSDFSFITEDKISEIFNLLFTLKIKVNLMQNSAISLSLCLEDKYGKLDELMEKLLPNYEMELEKEVTLYTLRYFEKEGLPSFTKGQELLRQIVKNTLQIIVKE